MFRSGLKQHHMVLIVSIFEYILLILKILKCRQIRVAMEKRGRGDALFRNLNRDDSVWTSAQLPQKSPLAKAQAKAAAKTVTAVTKTSASSAKSKSAQAFGEFGGMFFFFGLGWNLMKMMKRFLGTFVGQRYEVHIWRYNK